MSTIYLYVKVCPHCGLRYFGKTIQNPHVYAGSGKHWLRHLKKHDVKSITESIWAFESQDECTEFALMFSQENNIVESSTWANLKPETATDGGFYTMGWKHTNEAKEKISKALRGTKRRPLSEEHKRKISEAARGRKLSEDTKRKQSESKKGHSVSAETRKKLSDAWYRNNPAYLPE